MKRNNKRFKILSARNIALVVMTILMVHCVYLDSVDYEPTVNAGEEATFTMHVRVEPGENKNDVRLVIGYLVPKSWNAAENTVVTYTSNIDEGTKTMSLIPEGNLPKNGGGLSWSNALRSKFEFGPNVLEDMEWIAYWSDAVYSVQNQEKLSADISIQTVTGPENMRVKLGFFVNHTEDGINGTDHWKVLYTDCFDVINGEGDPVDFCQLHFNKAQPLQATKDDIITIKYQGDIAQNKLDDSEEVYLCATAFTDNGNSYYVCNMDDQSRMLRENAFGHTFSLTFWPAGYFGIPEGETVTKIQYSFLNGDGSVELQEVLEDMSEVPFVYTFSCK
ncbi:DUF4961 domain-containing protein [Sunxiuqinia sp. A32]|uniref:DUF4961 domain-containing protein n=1 Tax=Sunxiuqinia sp. A32 TaxID=3461496 RepID=UPI004045499F